MVDVDGAVPATSYQDSMPPLHVQVDSGTDSLAQSALTMADKAWRDLMPGETVYRLVKEEEMRQHSLETLYGWDKFIRRTLMLLAMALVVILVLQFIVRRCSSNNKQQRRQ